MSFNSVRGPAPRASASRIIMIVSAVCMAPGWEVVELIHRPYSVNRLVRSGRSPMSPQSCRRGDELPLCYNTFAPLVGWKAIYTQYSHYYDNYHLDLYYYDMDLNGNDKYQKSENYGMQESKN